MCLDAVEKCKNQSKAALLFDLLKSEKDPDFRWKMMRGIAFTSSSYFGYFADRYNLATGIEDKKLMLEEIGLYPDRRATNFIKNIVVSEKNEELLVAAMGYLGSLSAYKINRERELSYIDKETKSPVIYICARIGVEFAPPEEDMALNATDCKDLEDLFSAWFYSCKPEVQDKYFFTWDFIGTKEAYKALKKLSLSKDENVASEAKRDVDGMEAIMPRK
jgi:hypothetical protein